MSEGDLAMLVLIIVIVASNLWIGFWLKSRWKRFGDWITSLKQFEWWPKLPFSAFFKLTGVVRVKKKVK
jgi:Na+/proline symporter